MSDILRKIAHKTALDLQKKSDNPDLQDENFKWIDDFTLSDIRRIDRKLADSIQAKGAVTKEQYEAFLKKVANKEAMKELGKDIANKAIQTLLNKTLKISEGDKTVEIGGGNNNNSPPPPKKVPVGVWVAIGLILLVLVIFLIAKFGKK